MSKVNEFDKKHLSNLAKASKSIDTLYAAAAKELSRIAESTGHTGDEPFSFDKYPAAKRRAEKVYKELDANLLDLITTGEEEAWELSYDKNCALVDRITKGSGLTGEQIDRFKPRNMEALSAFQERKVNGMQLSENVWTIVDNGKTEFELALDVALGDGRSAAMLSRDVRKYLKDPAMLFRRVRGKDGVLRLSERARNYHPGQGVYRSSYKNAMRLARTEVNMAYHTADYEAWKDNDLVLGYEIILSNNHIPDICDELAGKYPKDFKFVGWHPQCRCVAVPITPSQEEFLKYAKAELNGEDVSDYQFEEVDFDGPAKLEGWAEENRERAKGWANMPYFVSDNPKYVPLLEGSADKLLSADLKNYSEYMQNNFRALENSLGVQRGVSMSFEEANEMRGNPHYGESQSYRVNCQSCVVANELRRRGFNVEALANTKGSQLELLSWATNRAWLNAEGKIPDKIYIGGRPKIKGMKITYPKVDWTQFEAETKAAGRYHVEWQWKGRRSGHIVTFERFADGTYRWYDPQSGAINFMDKQYASNIHSMCVLRVDNLRANPDICKDVLTKSGSKAVAGVASSSGVGAGYKDVNALIKDYYTVETNKEKVEILKQIVNDKKFKRLSTYSTKDNSVFGLNISNYAKVLSEAEMPANLDIAKKLVANKCDVYLLVNPNDTKSADFIVKRRSLLYYMEGKTLNGVGSFAHRLNDGAKQSNRVIIDMIGTDDTRYITKELKNAFDNNDLAEVILFKGTRMISISRRQVSSKTFDKDFRRIWEMAK